MGACRWVDEPASIDAAEEPGARFEGLGLPPLVGRLVECAVRRPRAEIYEGGWLLEVLPTGAQGLGPPLALLVRGELLVTIGARGSPWLDPLWRAPPAGVDAAQLAARAVLAALGDPKDAPAGVSVHLATRARVLASQREVIDGLDGHLPLQAARAQLERRAAALAHERAQLSRALGGPRSGRSLLARRAAPLAISLVACAASALCPGHRLVWCAAQAGLLLSLLTL
jgi:hypothetical protein